MQYAHSWWSTTYPSLLAPCILRQIVVVLDRFPSQRRLYAKCLEANISSFDAYIPSTLVLVDHLNFAVEEHFSLLELVLGDEGGPGNCILVARELSAPELRPLLFVLLVLSLRVRLAIKDQLVELVDTAEHRDNVLVEVVVLGRWVHEGSEFHAVFFEFVLFPYRNVEGFNHLLILQLHAGFCGSILEDS